MKFLILMLLMVFSSQLAVAGENSARCDGSISLLPNKDGDDASYTLIIGDKMIATGLTKTSDAFKSFIAECNKIKRDNYELNKDSPDSKTWIDRQCAGAMVIVSGAKCGMHFLLKNGGDEGVFQSPCHADTSTTDPVIKDLRDFCEKQN